MQENPNNAPEYSEEEGIDFVALLKGLWAGRKTIIICTAIFVVLGLAAALSMKRTYTVSTVLVPQVNSGRNAQLSSLAYLAGFDLGTNLSNSELSPVVYPQIVKSVPYLRELVNTPYHYSKADTALTMIAYAKDYNKPSPFSYVLKYTVGLPRTIIGAFKKKNDVEYTLPESAGTEETPETPKPILLSKEEENAVKALAGNINLAVDRKEGYLTLSVTGSEPIQTAELATKALTLLQEEITRFRTEKADKELEYILSRYVEVKEEAESLQAALATVKDRSQEMTSSRAQITRDRLQSKYAVANAIYMELSKQLEQARMQVKKDTPTFAVVQPVTVPTKPSNSRARTLFVWVFMGLVIGCGIVIAKDYLPKIKEMFKSEENKDA